jgi:hypothetical protein
MSRAAGPPAVVAVARAISRQLGHRDADQSTQEDHGACDGDVADVRNARIATPFAAARENVAVL